MSVTTTAMATEMKTKTEPIVTQMVSTNAAELEASIHLSTVIVVAGSVGGILIGIFLVVIVILTILVMARRKRRKDSHNEWTPSQGNSTINLVPEPTETVGMVYYFTFL